MADLHPSIDPRAYANVGSLLEGFHAAWAPEVNRRHGTFTSGFMRDETFPGIVRVVMALHPLVQGMLHTGWYELDRNKQAVHNDRKFKVCRPLAVMLARYRELDPISCDLVVEMLKVYEGKAGRHSAEDRSYEPFDATARIFRDRIAGFLDQVICRLPADEDLTGYVIPKGFLYPVGHATPGLETPTIPLPANSKGIYEFNVAAIRGMALAMHGCGHGITKVSAATAACLVEPDEIHRHVGYVDDDGRLLSDAETRDAFIRLRHESYLRSPLGILGVPQEGWDFQVVIIGREAFDALNAFHYSELLVAKVGMIKRDRTIREGASPLSPLRSLAMYGLRFMVGQASDPVWKADPDGFRDFLTSGHTFFISDDDPASVAEIVPRMNSVLAEYQDLRPVLDNR